ncbi:MAG: hypothetical protein AAB922_02250 [Patescibacteria group bacterium]
MARKQTPQTPLTHRRQDNNKRLTETERLIIHTDRVTSGATVRQVAKKYGVANATVTALEHDEGLKAKLLHAEHIKKALSADLYITAQRSLDAITDDRLLKVNAYQNAIITATCIDKARLIEGSSTQIVSVRTVVDDLEARKKELLRGLDAAIDITPSKQPTSDNPYDI